METEHTFRAARAAQAPLTTVEEIDDVLIDQEGSPHERVAGIVRNLGMVAILSGALIFILQRWGIADAITRCYTMIGSFCLLLCGGGLCTLGLKEPKSARAFFGMGAAVLPAIAVTFGGAFSSMYTTSLENSTVSECAFLIFLALGTLGIGSTVCASTLVRSYRKEIGQFLSISSIVLLIPWRDALATLVLGSALYAYWEYLETTLFSQDGFFSERTGRLVRAISPLPWILLFGRAVLYNAPAEPLVISFATLLVSRFLWCASEFFPWIPRAKGTSIVLVSFGMLPWVDQVRELIPDLTDISILTLMSVAAFLCIQALAEQKQEWIHYASISMLQTSAFLELGRCELFPSVFAVVSSISAALMAWELRSQLAFVASELLLVASFVSVILLGIDFSGISLWLIFLGLGGSLIAASAFIERHAMRVLRLVYNPFRVE